MHIRNKQIWHGMIARLPPRYCWKSVPCRKDLQQSSKRSNNQQIHAEDGNKSARRVVSQALTIELRDTASAIHVAAATYARTKWNKQGRTKATTELAHGQLPLPQSVLTLKEEDTRRIRLLLVSYKHKTIQNKQ
jgi:hypothetical protein